MTAPARQSNLAKLIRELRECEAKATPGKWNSDGCGDVWTDAEKEFCPAMEQHLFRLIGTTRAGPDRGDAAFIVLSRNSIFTLLSIIERQQKALEFYGHHKHFEYCGIDSFEPETASGGPVNWLCGGNDDSAFQYEDGSVALQAISDVEQLASSAEPLTTAQKWAYCSGPGTLAGEDDL